MRKAAHIAIVEDNRMLMAVRNDGTVGFIGGKQEGDECLGTTIRREFQEEINCAIPSHIINTMHHVMEMPVSKDLKCTLFLHKKDDFRDTTHIPHLMNIFMVNQELSGLIAVDISPENRKNLMKMNLANGVKEQMEVLFKHVL